MYLPGRQEEREVCSGKAELHPNCRVITIPQFYFFFLTYPIFLQPFWLYYCWIRWSEFSTEAGCSRRLDQSCPVVPTNPGDAVIGRALSSGNLVRFMSLRTTLLVVLCERRWDRAVCQHLSLHAQYLLSLFSFGWQ